MQKKTSLKKRIQNKRKIIDEMISQEEVDRKSLLKISQELDLLINEYMNVSSSSSKLKKHA